MEKVLDASWARRATGDVVSDISRLPGKADRRRARWIDAACLMLLLVVIVPRLVPAFQAATGIGGEERNISEWEVITLSGDALTSVDLEGRVVVVTFWATWCLYCEREMPSLQAVWEGSAGERVMVVGLSIDSGPDERISTYMGDRGYTFPVARGGPR